MRERIRRVSMSDWFRDFSGMVAEGIFGPRGLAAHWCGYLPTVGPPPRDAGSGPFQRDAGLDADWDFLIQNLVQPKI